MRRRAYLAGVGATGVAALAGCTALADTADDLFGGEPYDIGMSRHSFEPEEYETTVGDPVVWKNTSEADHTVTAYEDGLPEGASFFASGGYETEAEASDAYWNNFGGAFSTGETYEHTFEVPGTYAYYCVPHEKDGRGDGRMMGLVHVEE
ncbi:plastocyanin/azurin family copper-binding protein [Halovivax sp.]|uniref:cupredoxin domain-containing protein n=1 Tax=Halovivax sp. TaxID=1935978 RepID=UPI0025BDFC84|nr:plastocyanin/azurin family copper-binding protein [Halovivax sp.]